MKCIYVVISYIESSDGSMRVKSLDGYTHILQLAQLYIDTHVGKYDIMVYQGTHDSDVFSDIFEDYGYAVDSDVQMEIKMIGSSDGKYHVVDTSENMDTLLYEVSMFDEISRESTTSYINITSLSNYMKDNNFNFMMNYISSKYFAAFIRWMQNCDDFDYYTDYSKYPIDVVSALVIFGYLTPVEHIRERQ